MPHWPKPRYAGVPTNASLGLTNQRVLVSLTSGRWSSGVHETGKVDANNTAIKNIKRTARGSRRRQLQIGSSLEKCRADADMTLISGIHFH